MGFFDTPISTSTKSKAKSAEGFFDTGTIPYVPPVQPEQPSTMGKVGGFVKDIAKAIVSPVATLAARPVQLGAELLGATPEQVNKVTLGGLVAPVPMGFADVKKDVGRGIETAALALPGMSVTKSALGGAAFGLGSSMEQGSKILSPETAKSVLLGGALGAAAPVAIKGVSKLLKGTPKVAPVEEKVATKIPAPIVAEHPLATEARKYKTAEEFKQKWSESNLPKDTLGSKQREKVGFDSINISKLKLDPRYMKGGKWTKEGKDFFELRPNVYEKMTVDEILKKPLLIDDGFGVNIVSDGNHRLVALRNKGYKGDVSVITTDGSGVQLTDIWNKAQGVTPAIRDKAVPAKIPKTPEYIKSVEDRAQKLATKDPEFNPSSDSAKIVKFDEVSKTTSKEQLIKWGTGLDRNTPDGLPATTVRGLLEEDMLANPSKYTPDEIFRVSTSAVNSEAGALLQGVKVKRGGVVDTSMDFIRQEQSKLQEKIKAERLITKTTIKRFLDELPACTI